MDAASSSRLEKQREKYRARLDAALEEEEDPLAAYHEFVKWTIDNYQQRLIARSGLLELLEEATRRFKDDSAYKSDLRYLKLWSLFASHVEDPTSIYDFLLTNDIGKIYAQVYEDYAAALEANGRRTDADKIYQLGIQRRARPLERLKKRYAEFQSRPNSSRPSSHSNSSLWRDAPSQTQALRRDPFLNYPDPKPGHSSRSRSTNTHSSTASSSAQPSSSGHDHNRYAHILAPPVPGKRPEKLRFNLSLLFTKESGEFSIAEARARSMGLLGKKWGPPPEATRVNFSDEGSKTRNTTGRKAVGFAAPEPTVTLATKEALADVFGMYNSPDRSQRYGPVAGSKHAPVRKIEPITPMSLHAPFRAATSNENADASKTPTAFRPYVDQSAIKKENSTPAPPQKFKPYVDEDASFAPQRNENAFPPKTPSTFRPLQEEPRTLPKVFTPAAPPLERVLSRKDIFVDEPKLAPPPPQSENSVFSQPGFKVFSRPPASTENAPPPAPPPASAPAPSVFKPFVDNAPPSRQPFVPTRSVLGERTPFRPVPTPQPVEEPEEQAIDPEEDYYDYSTTESSDIDDPPRNLEVPIEGEEDPNAFDDDDVDSYQVPLGGRLGQFNVMTPITERTYEFTSSTRGLPTPYDPLGRAFHNDPVVAAEQLAAELRQEEEEEEEADDEVKYIEERTGTLSLSDAIAVASKFNPPNPCNPFDPPIMSTLLSLVPMDLGFRDMRSQESNQLDALQKFGRKKARRASGNSNSSRSGNDDRYKVNLADRSYEATEKLGEGGFGAVFAAIDIHAAQEKRRQEGMDDEDSDDFDDDEETPRVALKVVKPRNLWEFHVLRQIHRTLSPQPRRSIITPEALYAYKDESFLVLELCEQGSLLDVINRAPQAGITQQGACLDELLVMFFSIELIRLIEGMHKAGFIHGDVKIDNCLLRLEDVPGSASSWSTIYQPSGEGGWSYKGVKMIDFGRTIDTKLFPSGQQYIGDWDTDARDCLEMREGRPWSYQTDYFGLAGIIYCLLYGKYIEASSVTLVASSAQDQPRYKLSTPFKRYWQGDIWTRLFDLLLNSSMARPDGKLPLCEELGGLRVEMETWLQANCNRASNSLKGLLKKISVSLY
ncbi:hypothetical protein NLI96_g434 [Meripilus lineatus]|uniref:Uncharacterized protein n=1 Tax=Meripilus lineatus TaxID=2056292 RepID=A0AAD5YJB1_9APHY|nr:hypothetical protein NLI96_g434 [Physisporinus lineatus]